MQLQQFVTEVIEELGGVVVNIEYALCHVLIPEAYRSYFQDKSELVLSFDFEVAEENPDSEFVTFGSYILEQVLKIVQEEAKSTLRFAEVERLELGQPLKKITNYLGAEAGKLSIVSDRPVLGAWAVFQYTVAYVADERMEDTEQVWVNLLTGEISQRMKEEQNRIIYSQEPVYTYPLPASIDIVQAFETATSDILKMTEDLKRERLDNRALTRELDRITNYYTDLLGENNKRINRKGLSEEKKQDIIVKSTAIELERDKQLQEIHQKYTGKVELDIDNGILYFIPLLEYTVENQFRDAVVKRIIYYNPITKDFFE